MNFSDLTILEISKSLQNKDFSAAEITKYYLANIKKHQDLNAFITVTEKEALQTAKKIDELRSDGEDLPILAGVPVAVKDIILTKGIQTTAGSKILKDFIAPYDATVWANLSRLGAIMLGKTNCDEFAMGSSNETSAYGPVLNPWDKAKVPGGSSGGSAVAVAADLCAYALGTDTGGSIRQPAGLCGVVGLKPTYGRLSRYGLVAMTSSLDQPGPMTKTVKDAAFVLGAMAGGDEHDSTLATKPVDDYLANLDQNIKGMKIGLPKEYLAEGLNAEVKSKIDEVIKVLEKLGAEIVEVSLPHTAYALAVYYIIMPAEASSNLARYDGIRYGYSAKDAKDLWEVYTKSKAQGFGAEVKRRIIIGTYVLSAGYQDAYYKKALKVQNVIKQEYQEIFKKVDCLLTPTNPTPAFSVGEKNDPLEMYLSDIFTVSANIAGLCGISVPAGLSANGLPIGAQFLGAPFAESKILQIAHQFEQATDWRNQHPKL